MTTDEITKLDDGELRMKVAEYCGWKFTKVKDAFEYISVSPNGQSYRTNWGQFVIHLPDYPNDLNAMHQAEIQIPDNDEAQQKYYTAICFLTNWAPVYCGISQHKANFDMLHITARTRAEAFVMTMQK